MLRLGSVVRVVDPLAVKRLETKQWLAATGVTNVTRQLRSSLESPLVQR
ncbi:hypothetical protein AVDCRST_MAG94-3043 [uncultured Leptolyngbya sp.]|uniref:Uncharacterized protein n=1 Tax=uncultured Leptolyngbya sp. TaxID=332963 RepID=A0A6J4MBV2_9CYAN|nr:hypothetical protein AVDCRST_MAG94-3043 [uncultured Leptolyngbya sp.]